MLFVTKNEDTFYSCYLYVKKNSTFLLSHHMTVQFLFVNYPYILERYILILQRNQKACENMLKD